MENNENKQSLLNKLSTKLKSKYNNFKVCIKKSIKTVANKACPLVLAAAIALTPLAFSACNNNVDPNTPTNPPIVDVNPGSGEQPGIEIPGIENPGAEIPGQDDQENEQSQYSQLLQNVMNNEYYNNLIELAKQDNSYTNSAYFAEHPYAILEEYGVDTAAIKRSDLECKTYSFVKNSKPNNLFLYTYAENAGGYYDEFSFEYELTEQEMKDYKMLHNIIPGNNQNANVYYQMCFINDQLSKDKDPIAVTHTKMAIDVHKSIKNDDDLLGRIKGSYNYQALGVDVILKKCDAENNVLTLIIFPTNMDTISNYMNVVELEYEGLGTMITVKNGVFTKPSNITSGVGLNEIKNAPISVQKSVKMHFQYIKRFADMNDIKTGELDLEN